MPPDPPGKVSRESIRVKISPGDFLRDRKLGSSLVPGVDVSFLPGKRGKKQQLQLPFKKASVWGGFGEDSGEVLVDHDVKINKNLRNHKIVFRPIGIDRSRRN